MGLDEFKGKSNMNKFVRDLKRKEKDDAKLHAFYDKAKKLVHTPELEEKLREKQNGEEEVSPEDD